MGVISPFHHVGPGYRTQATISEYSVCIQGDVLLIQSIIV